MAPASIDSTFNFFLLPAELRNQIYAHATRKVYIRPLGSTVFTAGIHDSYTVLNLMLVNKQFKSEYVAEASRCGELRLFMQSPVPYKQYDGMKIDITQQLGHAVIHSTALAKVLSQVQSLEINFNYHQYWNACSDTAGSRESAEDTRHQLNKLPEYLSSLTAVQYTYNLSADAYCQNESRNSLDILHEVYLEPVSRLQSQDIKRELILWGELYAPLPQEVDKDDMRSSSANVKYFAFPSQGPYMYEGHDLVVAATGADAEWPWEALDRRRGIIET